MNYDYPSDEVMHRLAAINEPLHKRAMVKRLAHEQKMDERVAAMWPAQHPFEYDPKKPSLHP